MDEDEKTEVGKIYKKKRVLDEDEYVEMLEKIIERDFFPEIPKLRRQAMWLNMMSKKDPEGLQRSLEELNPSDNMPKLDTFVHQNVSEDNAAFSVLLEKTQEEHRRKYNWAFDSNPTETSLKLLKNGSKMDSETRLIFDSACASKEQLIVDQRPNQLDTWKYTARNALSFQPQSRRPSAVSNGNPKLRLGRVGKARRLPKAIEYANCSLSNEPSSSSLEKESTNGEYPMVEMTPAPNPEQETSSPFMTWGEIESTPMLLSSFQMTPVSQREQLALDLEAKSRKRKVKREKKTGLTPAGKRMMRRLTTPSVFSSSITDNLLK